MYDHTLHRGKNFFTVVDYMLLVQKNILKHHIKNCFKVNDKQRIAMPKKSEYVKFKNY